MTRNVIVSFTVLICFVLSVSAQTSKNTTKKPAATASGQSNAEKMGYARTNKYWGPGTFYLYAPGKPNNKMANNAESAMRDLTGISEEDLYKELARQGFAEIPKKDAGKTWFNESKDKETKYYYSSDKSYVLVAHTKDMYRSPVTENGKYAFASHSVNRWVLYPKEDSVKVLDAVWQYLRDLDEMKVILSSFASDFKKADPKAYPIQQVGSSGWTSLRAGTFVLKMVDGKPKGYWERNIDILRRTIGMPEFHLEVSGMETDFWYGLNVKLKKEGYVLNYSVLASNLGDLEPANTWAKEYPRQVQAYNSGIKADKDAVNLYKTAPLPPKLEDLNKLMHIR